MKTFYSYDYNGKYIDEVKGELCQVTELKKLSDPDIESVYISPSYSTDIAPPAILEGHETIFNGSSWDYKEIPKPEGKPVHIPDYKELRIAAYPSIYEYLDGVIKSDTNQIQKYIDDCKAVKLKYPKV